MWLVLLLLLLLPRLHSGVRLFPLLDVLAWLLFAAIASAANTTLAPIEIVDNQFRLAASNTRFLVKGIAYQQMRQPGFAYDPSIKTGYLDPLANATACRRDLDLLTELGVNVVRVYQVDPMSNHDECMAAYALRGIYVLADLAEPNTSIDRAAPQWNVDLLRRYTAVVDALHHYPNVLGFFAGNEVTTSTANTDASPFVKAAIRDVKQHIADKKYRAIPVGYATNDDVDTRMSVSQYFACDNVKADFLGINMYEWCGHSTFATLGYRQRTLEYANFPMPLFFSEYGCNTVRPRPFTEVEVMYSSVMTGVWSGGIAYLYFEGENHYGVVEEAPDGSVAKMADFDNLQQRLKPARATTELQPQREGIVSPPCPAGQAWRASTQLPPTPDPDVCLCVYNTLQCVASPYHVDFDVEELVAEVCQLTSCDKIAADGAAGVYGSMALCTRRQQASFVLNQYYQEAAAAAASRNETARHVCDFDGRAILVQGQSQDWTLVFTDEGRSCASVMSPTVERTPVVQNATAQPPTTSATTDWDDDVDPLESRGSPLAVCGAVSAVVVATCAVLFVWLE